MKSTRVTVPATAANLGPGFDALGLAVNLRNEVILRAAGQMRRSGEAIATISIEGHGVGTLPTGRANLVVKAAQRVFGKVRCVPERLSVKLVNRIPLASGLGSSAAACVGGLVAANVLSGRTLSADQLLEMAAEMEGHPDNIAPALLGGFTICAMGDKKKIHVLQPRVRRDLNCVFCVPQVGIATSKSRRAPPLSYKRSDVVFSLSRAAMLTALLQGGATTLLRVAVQDRLHQPWRATLLPGMAGAMKAAEKAGALGACISGAGPTILAFVERTANSDRIGRAMCRAFASRKIRSEASVLSISTDGARINKA